MSIKQSLANIVVSSNTEREEYKDAEHQMGGEVASKTCTRLLQASRGPLRTFADTAATCGR